MQSCYWQRPVPSAVLVSSSKGLTVAFQNKAIVAEVLPRNGGGEGGHNGERIDIEGSYVSTQRGSDSRFLNAARESSGRRCPMQYALDREDVENYRGSNLLNLKTKQSNLIAKGWPCSVRGFPTVTTSAASCRRPARKQVYLHTNGPGEKAG